MTSIPAAPSVVVFDIGNVLIDWDPRRLYRKLFVEEAACDAFLRDVCDMDWNLEQDRGRTFAAAVAERIERFPHLAREIRAYDERWGEMVSGPIPGAVALQARLRAAGTPLYAITNFSREKFDYVRSRFAFLSDFDGIVVSADVGLVKPDPAIFELFLRRFSLPAAACLFIDDSLANVKAARGVGMSAHHFLGAEGLEAQLREFGFL